MSAELFGELYLRSTKPFLSEQATQAEVAYLLKHLPEDPLLDLGCGHGRHTQPLARARQIVGVDLDPLSLREASSHASVVRADFFKLPFRAETFGGAFAWYNTLFTFDDSAIRALLAEITRCLKVGATLVIQNSNIAKAEAEPVARYEGVLPDGSQLIEETEFDAKLQSDGIRRTLKTPDGRLMVASFRIRYYRIDELTALLHDVGLEQRWVHGGVDEGPLTKASVDLIVGAVKRG